MLGASGRSRSLKLAFAASCAAAIAVTIGRRKLQRWLRQRHLQDRVDRWCGRGPAKEPIVECEVPIEHGMSGADVETDVVEVPVGLVLECDRLRAELRQHLGLEQAVAPSNAEIDEPLVEALSRVWDKAAEAEEADVDAEEDVEAVIHVSLPWLDLAALAQLTYWYDRRPQGEEVSAAASPVKQDNRPTDSKYGRWTKKISREKVIYGTVALRYRSRAHLGQQVFRRPAGIDVTRLTTLRRAAALCGHEPLSSLVEQTMEQLQPRNVARIPWSEVKKHTSKDDLWLMIDRKVYDVTPFLDLHPGGGQLIVDAAGKDATSAFELTHGEGLRYSLRLLNQFFIGVCDGAEEAEPASPLEASPEFLTTLRSITGALHTFDEAKATGEAQGILR